MIYLLDTNAISDLARATPGTVDGLDRAMAAGAHVCTSVIVVGEVRAGIHRLPVGRRREELSRKMEELLRLLPAFPVTADETLPFGRLRSDCEARGVAVSENDLWIAATAERISAVIVTRDRYFSRLSGVRVAEWV